MSRYDPLVRLNALPLCLVGVLVGCPADSDSTSEGADPTDDPTSAGTGTTSVDPSATDSSTGAVDPTDDPTGTGSADSTSDPTEADTSTSTTDATTGGDPVTAFALEVEVDLGGVFDVTADATITITITKDAFISDVVTITIAGGPEVYEIELAGTVDGQTLTMTDSMFMIEVAGNPETHSVSGTATLGADTVTGSGTVISDIGAGRPIAGTWTIVSATPL